MLQVIVTNLFQILEALTTERCLERMSLERFEVLGDAFLKYVVGRHNFILYEGLDEGQLTRRRSAVVNNSNLYELSIRRNLQVSSNLYRLNLYLNRIDYCSHAFDFSRFLVYLFADLPTSLYPVYRRFICYLK